MGIFDFIKGKKQVTNSLEKILQRIVDYMPIEYIKQRQFINCKEFLNNGEWGLALDSLIELTDETGHYFSEEYWQNLIDAADSMSMEKESDFCKQQIKKTKRNLDFKLSFGSTVDKIDDTHFQHYISEKIKDNWAKERYKKDKVDQLLLQNGVHYISHGRNGFFYYVDNGRLADIEYELGTEGLIIWFTESNYWTLPNKQKFTPDEKLKIKTDIEIWSKKTKNAIDFD